MNVLSPSVSEPAGAAYQWLLGLRPRGIVLGLDRVEAALARLGDPQRGLAAVTIAGTNGKGSTARFLEQIAHAAGYRVGLYTSPHLVSVTERIRVGCVPMSPDDFVERAARVRRIVEGAGGRGAAPIPLTFFEALTVMALDYFARREVDLAILEVGLGGRLDATNVVAPLVSVLTPVGMDHEAFLGPDIESICREKAGIMKPRVPVVCNVRESLFRAVIGPRALELRCPIRRAGVDYIPQWLSHGFRYRGWIHSLGPLRLGMLGLHQGDNAAAACAAAECLAAHGFGFKPVDLAEGLTRARNPGRLERRPPNRDPSLDRPWPALLLDAAHNPMGARVLAHQLPYFLPERPRVLLFATKEDKDSAAMLAALAPKVDTVVLTTLREAPSTPLADLAAITGTLGLRTIIDPDPASALDAALRLATPNGGLAIAGSIFLLGDILPVLPHPHLAALDTPPGLL